MKLEDIMIREVIQIIPDECIAEAAKRMRQQSIGCLVVSLDGAIKGIITDRDLIECLEQGHDPYRCKIATHMSHPVIVLRPEEDHAIALSVLRKRRIKRLPLARSGKLLGIISMSDLAGVAEGELERLWPSWVSITDLIRAQAVQAQRAAKVQRGEENMPAKKVA
ncbi:MAG TPA: CBS domain-containing protein [Candidatus Binatia bacterium]|nr:CBS domain-containing protein [Candidatus Binatia bacterium]